MWTMSFKFFTKLDKQSPTCSLRLSSTRRLTTVYANHI